MSYNVPDDWGSYYTWCEHCGARYHLSEGGCGCEELQREKHQEELSELLTNDPTLKLDGLVKQKRYQRKLPREDAFLEPHGDAEYHYTLFLGGGLYWEQYGEELDLTERSLEYVAKLLKFDPKTIGKPEDWERDEA